MTAAITALIAAAALPASAQTTWAPEPTPPGEAWLTDVVELNDRDLWSFGATGGGHSLVLHRADDGSWKRVEVPDIGPIGAATHEGYTDLWAAGQHTVLHHAGGTWETMPLPPVPDGWQRQFTSMTWAPNEVWLAGTETRGTSTARGVVLRWDGETWQRMSLPGAGSNWGIESLSGAGGKQSWAAGWTRSGNVTKPVLYQYDWQGGWQAVPVPRINGNGWFMEAHGAALGDVFLAGSQVLPDGRTRPLVMHYYVGEWVPVQVPADYGARLRTSSYSYGEGGILFAGAHDAERAGYLLTCDSGDNVCQRVPGPSAPSGDVVINEMEYGSTLQQQVAVGSLRDPGVQAYVARGDA